MKKILFFIITMMPTIILYAETLDRRIIAVSRSGFALGNFFMLLIGIASIILVLLGVWGFKKYADDSRTNNLVKPLLYLLGGGLLAGFTAFSYIISNTLTGEGDDRRTGDFNARDLR